MDRKIIKFQIVEEEQVRFHEAINVRLDSDWTLHGPVLYVGPCKRWNSYTESFDDRPRYAQAMVKYDINNEDEKETR